MYRRITWKFAEFYSSAYLLHIHSLDSGALLFICSLLIYIVPFCVWSFEMEQTHRKKIAAFRILVFYCWFLHCVVPFCNCRLRHPAARQTEKCGNAVESQRQMHYAHAWSTQNTRISVRFALNAIRMARTKEQYGQLKEMCRWDSV